MLPRFRDGFPDGVEREEDSGPFPIWTNHIEGWPVVGHPPWDGPSADLTVHLTGTARSEYLLMRNFARRAGDGYASLEIELWDPTEGLVASGTQTMIFTFSNGIPEGNDRFAIDVRRRLAAE